MTDVNFVILAP